MTTVWELCVTLYQKKNDDKREKYWIKYYHYNIHLCFNSSCYYSRIKVPPCRLFYFNLQFLFLFLVCISFMLHILCLHFNVDSIKTVLTALSAYQDLSGCIMDESCVWRLRSPLILVNIVYIIEDSCSSFSNFLTKNLLVTTSHPDEPLISIFLNT